MICLIQALMITGCTEAKTGQSYDSAGENSFAIQKIVSGLNVPWGMAFISEREMLITERQGTIKKLNLDSGELTDIAGAPEVLARGQGGLMDVRTSPNYSDDGWLYFTYSKKMGTDAATALARSRFDGSSLIDFEELFVSNHSSSAAKHFGSRIAFDGKGHIFFGVGERGSRPTAQDLADHSGSIIRLNLDGSVPPDNPFVGRDNAMPEIWSYGHRNPQGLAYDPETDRLWDIEHGPRGGDEINLVEPGNNYGWPVISYGREYREDKMVGESTHKEGMEQPIKYYVPSIAPSSLLFYSGEYYPEFKGDLLAGALALTHLNQINLDDSGKPERETRHFEGMNERIRNVVQGPDGKIYLSTDSGKLLVLNRQ